MPFTAKAIVRVCDQKIFAAYKSEFFPFFEKKGGNDKEQPCSPFSIHIRIFLENIVQALSGVKDVITILNLEKKSAFDSQLN